jgi:hypothetical protein
VSEVEVDALNGIYAWRAPRAGVSLIRSRLGRVVLTTERFLFLSTGTSGVGRDLLLGPVGSSVLRLTVGERRTDELDLRALATDGSLSIALECITHARVERRWDFANYLVLETAGTGVLPRACSFMTKFGFDRKALVRFLETLEWARTRSRSSVVEPRT